MLSTTWYTYYVRCNDGSIYGGITTDLSRRVKQHNGELPGGAKYTRGRGPVQLAYVEVHSNRSDASKREYYLKKKLSATKKKEIISNYINTLFDKGEVRCKCGDKVMYAPKIIRGTAPVTEILLCCYDHAHWVGSLDECVFPTKEA